MVDENGCLSIHHNTGANMHCALKLQGSSCVPINRKTFDPPDEQAINIDRESQS